ncbi:helix-turn-helix domain-containing protein [Staphylococcus equorum]|uniref:helix-turn-helix domain-containing protein n=1 Tax=Staphylococcus equorum TaxID=246432 RepID=UPI003EBD455A
MTIRCNLSILMGRERYNIQDVHEKTGLSRKSISNLYNDKTTRIDFETIEKICTLFNCSIGDLFENSNNTKV